MRKRIYVIGLIFSLFFVMAVTAAPTERNQTEAEGLAIRLPDEVVAFAATSGGDDLADAFDQSRLGRIWAEDSVQEFYRGVRAAVLPALRDRMPAERRQAFDAVHEFLAVMLRRPTVWGVGQRTAGVEKTVYGFGLIDGRERREEIQKSVMRLEATAGDVGIADLQIMGRNLRGLRGPEDTLIYWGWIDDLFVFSVNDQEGDLVGHLTKKTTATQPAHVRAFDQVPGTDDAFVLFIDFQRYMNYVRTASEQISALMEEMGFGRARDFIGRVGFDGPDIAAYSFLETPEPRAGLMGRSRTIDLEDLDVVPANVTRVSLVDVDLAGVYDHILNMMRVLTDEGFPQILKAIAEFEAETGVNIRRDLLAQFTGPMVSYAFAEGAGMSRMLLKSDVIVTGVKDQATLTDSIKSIEQFVVEQTEGQFQVSTQEIGDRVYHQWMAMPFAAVQLAPAWTIDDDTFVWATRMPFAGTAIRQATTQPAEPTSIRSVEAFRELTGDLPEGMTEFQYIDHALETRANMAMWNQMWPMAVMMAEQRAQIKLPPVLPPAEDIARHLGPSVSYQWVRKDGIRSQAVGPVLPLDLRGVALVQIIQMIGPERFSHRETQQRVSLSNLRQIGIACVMYSEAHRGQFPDRLEQLVEGGYLDSRVLESPLKPDGFDGPSYIYIPGNRQDKDRHFDNILVYENPAYLTRQMGINALLVDASVFRLDAETFERRLAETYERLGRPMPQIEYAETRPTFLIGSFE